MMKPLWNSSVKVVWRQLVSSENAKRSTNKASVLSLKFAALVHFIPSKNLPFPSLLKRGENRMETIPPLKKGDTGGFAFDFICRER
jgi:hypothetical protein